MVTGLNYFVHFLYMHIVRELYFRVIKILPRPLNVLRCPLHFSGFNAGITPPGHICVLINLLRHRGGRWVAT